MPFRILVADDDDNIRKSHKFAVDAASALMKEKIVVVESGDSVTPSGICWPVSFKVSRNVLLETVIGFSGRSNTILGITFVGTVELLDGS